MKRILRMGLVAVLVVAAHGAMAQTGHPRPTTHRSTLQQDTEVQGYPCAKGYAWLYADGKLERCAVSKEFVFGDAKLPLGSILALAWSGAPKYAMMKHDAEVGGVNCAGGNRLLGPSEGATTWFYPSGRLKGCYLAGDQVVQGVPCRHREGILGVAYGLAVKHPNDPDIEFFESGKLQSCELTKDLGTLRRGDRFHQDP